MNLNKTHGFLVVGLVLGGAALGWRSAALEEIAAPPPPREISLTSPPPIYSAATAGLGPGLEELPRWDEIGSHNRPMFLDGRFATAVAAIKAGAPFTTVQSIRAELYGTTAGRAQHRNFELKLGRVLDRAPEGAGR